ncbi:hypothetical protein RJ639_036356 [Escallonia herrerae]|uniref:Glycosyl transferase family 28 C-terminal domain-containing protein n=1 Tax=Escallonia herrerae TaxID=1293975 RepID=A0AA88WT91_9ASTE|nr:hypothetical protein RJ639_036356 [Escallonia herrerae]
MKNVGTEEYNEDTIIGKVFDGSFGYNKGEMPDSEECGDFEEYNEETIIGNVFGGRVKKSPARHSFLLCVRKWGTFSGDEGPSVKAYIELDLSASTGEDGSLTVDYFTFSSSIADYLRSASLVISHAGTLVNHDE